MFTIEGNVEWNADQVAQFHDMYFDFAKAPVPGVLKERLEYIRDKLSPSPSYMDCPIMAMPTPKLYSATPPTPGTSQTPDPTLPVRDSDHGDSVN